MGKSPMLPYREPRRLDVFSVGWARVVLSAALVSALGFPEIRFEHNRTVGLFDPDSPAARRAAIWEGMGANPVDLIMPRLLLAQNPHAHPRDCRRHRQSPDHG
jgi:hypothetical protein